MVIVREATEEDMPRIRELAMQIQKQHEDYGDINKLKTNARQIIDNFYRNIMKSSRIILFVADDGGEVVGYALGEIEKRDPFYEEEFFGILDEIIVDESHQSKGTGKKLLEEIFNWFRKNNIKYAELEVDRRNGKAHNIWEKQGFEVNTYKMSKKLV